MDGRYFVVNDDIVVADCPTDELAAKVACCIVLSRKDYKLVVSAIVGEGIQVRGGCSSRADSNLRAIASVKQYLNQQAPKAFDPHPLIGKTFYYQKRFDNQSRLYTVANRCGSGVSTEGSGALLECLALEGEFEPWQYFVARKVLFYESELQELIET